MADDGFDQAEEDNINYKSISCERIPELFLDKLVAKKHFSKFGKINRFILRPNRLCCTVDYETEQDAANAYAKAGSYNGYDFIVTYAEKEVGHVQNTEEWVDPDVQAELDAMGQRNHKVPNSQLRQSFMKPPMQQRAVKPFVPKTIKSVPLLQPAPEQMQLPKIDVAVRMELEAMLRKPAYTDEEKYRVLDARDKLIRLTTVRQTDIKKAVSTKGTCPDMCPEKERLMREFQRQVATFEMSNSGSNSTINHRRAIKEYSRSSADQEVPLGHELRAENVLQMTMLYLMSSIMDLCDDAQTSIADWFHFVWDRTRSIRKDITQQELCSLGGVQLVEQCARFHIHCAARLVAEDPSVFDKKINAENLTKCLQTLKYMYHDLRIKKICCPCEAEFRGYIVLLNLGDANFLWELKQLPEEIQHSEHIKRAIAFYNALQNNNYVRFFSMIRNPETPYLSACILLGYFTKLRLKAMQAIVKSYTWRKNPSWLPIPYLMRVLGFENADAAVEFFSAHGLQCDGGRVKLDRLSMPDMEYTMDREMMLVESKRNVSVGECICGHPLESTAILDKHQPHNSFDSNGLLKPEAWNADDQLRGEAAAAAVHRTKQFQQQQTRIFQQPQPQVTPSSRTTDTIFKIPLTTPPISAKQHQQQSYQQADQHSTKISNPVPSIFGGNQFGREPSEAATTSRSTFSLPAAAQLKSTGLFSSVAPPSADTGASIFKIPLVSGSAAQKPTDAASASAFFNSRFTPNTDKPTTATGIFGGFVKKPTPSPSAVAGGNIFGAAAKETVNIFQQQQQQPQQQQQHQQLKAMPLPTDNIFKHFQTTAPAFEAPVRPSNNIFGTVDPTTTTTPALPTTDINLAAKKALDETLARKRELEEQQRQKLAELEEERRKLKAFEKQKEHLRELAKRQKRLDALNEKTAHEYQILFENLLTDEIRQLSAAELVLFQDIEHRTLQLTSELIDECVLAQVQEIQNEEYALMCHDQMILYRYFERWLQATRKKLEQRQLLETTPMWVTSATRAQQSQQVQHPKQAENLKMIKRYRLGQPCDFKQLLSPPIGGYGRPQCVNIFELISQYFKRKQPLKDGVVQRQKYFKLLLTLPKDREELHGFEGMCNRWLHKYLRPHHQPTTDNCYINGVVKDVALCVRKLTGMLPTNESGQRVRSHESDNADAIICFMTGDNLRNTRRRLHHLLKLSKLYKPVPISLVVYNSNIEDERKLAHSLDLDNFIADGKVSSFNIFGSQESKNDFNFYTNMKRAVRFVARESSFNNTESEALEMQKLPSWLEEALGEAMWQRWQETSMQNPVFGKICSMPRFVVALYNESLQRLQDIVTEDFQEAPEFAEELHQFVPPQPYDIPLGLEHFPKDWKSTQRCEKLLNFFKSIHLPALTEQQLPLEAEIDDLELALLNYVSSCIPNDDVASTQAAYEAIKTLIELLNNVDLQVLELPLRLAAICWLPVIKPVVLTLISLVMKQTGPALPREVIYRRQAFSDYQQLPWWLNFAPMLCVTVDYTQTQETTDNSSANDNPVDDVETVIQHGEAALLKAEENLFALRQKSSKIINDELTRELDENFYQFELAKNCGSFTTILPDYDEDDAEMSSVENDSDNCNTKQKKSSPQGKKRKLDEPPTSEVDAVMAKAFALIEQIELKQDRSPARKQTRKTLLHEF